MLRQSGPKELFLLANTSKTTAKFNEVSDMEPLPVVTGNAREDLVYYSYSLPVESELHQYLLDVVFRAKGFETNQAFGEYFLGKDTVRSRLLPLILGQICDRRGALQMSEYIDEARKWGDTLAGRVVRNAEMLFVESGCVDAAMYYPFYKDITPEILDVTEKYCYRASQSVAGFRRLIHKEGQLSDRVEGLRTICTCASLWWVSSSQADEEYREKVTWMMDEYTDNEDKLGTLLNDVIRYGIFAEWGERVYPINRARLTDFVRKALIYVEDVCGGSIGELMQSAVGGMDIIDILFPTDV